MGSVMHEGVGPRTMTDCFSNWLIVSKSSRSNVRLVFGKRGPVSYYFFKPVGHACPDFSEAKRKRVPLVCRPGVFILLRVLTTTTKVKLTWDIIIFVPVSWLAERLLMKRETSFEWLPLAFLLHFGLFWNMPPKKKLKPEQGSAQSQISCVSSKLARSNAVFWLTNSIILCSF